ncbi:MAG: ATP-binding cassette domain-containing protein [Bacteroidetes bacterium]|nr:MAG: ATP-binding cassette domain-containing protein [Bacteroidota bacterium]
MLSLSHISKTFHTGTLNETRALQDINLQIKQGEFVVVIGANGSGKSSLLNIIAGAYLPDQGNITLDNTDITRLPDYRRSQWIARMFQNPLLGTASDLSIIDNFRLASLRTQRKTFKIGNNASFKKIVQERIALLNMGLENRLEQPIGSLSGGQRQALTLLMATMDSAKLLLMDEPTAALDPRSASNFMEKASEIIAQFELTTLLITHALRDAHQYGTRLLQMQEGAVLRDVGEAEKKQLDLATVQSWFAN